MFSIEDERTFVTVVALLCVLGVVAVFLQLRQSPPPRPKGHESFKLSKVAKSRDSESSALKHGQYFLIMACVSGVAIAVSLFYGLNSAEATDGLSIVAASVGAAFTAYPIFLYSALKDMAQEREQLRGEVSRLRREVRANQKESPVETTTSTLNARTDTPNSLPEEDA